ncbi:MAG: TrmH family RNA methyltransferase [Parcubacteria group bacterium]
MKKPKDHEVVVLLHNIRSTHNVGSIFRTSDALGVKSIYISGYTPTPLDKFNRPRKDIAKVALGAEKTIPWQYIDSPIKTINKLKKEGYEVVTLEQSKNSVDYKNFKPKYPILFVLGSEVEGVEEKIINLSDKIVEIPMMGDKESLNVSVAFGVALFRILNI